MSNHSHNAGSSLPDAQVVSLRYVILTSTVPGTVVCGLVLVTYAIVATSSRARRRLDRVSLRLIIYALASYVVFGIANSVYMPELTGRGCREGRLLCNLFLSLAICLTTCIAINLQIVLVHGINSKKVEKYYTICTIILCMSVNIPTFLLNQDGSIESNVICWFDPSPVGISAVWVALAIMLPVIEFVCSTVVLLWLYRFKRSIRKLMAGIVTPNDFSTAPIDKVGASWYTSQPGIFSTDPRYQKIVLRIALYPIISLVTIVVNIVLGFMVNSSSNFGLISTDIVLYGVRSLAFGVLAACDPALLSALQETKEPKKGSSFKVNHPVEFSLGGVTFPLFSVSEEDSNALECSPDPNRLLRPISLKSRSASSSQENVSSSVAEQGRGVIEVENFRAFECQL